MGKGRGRGRGVSHPVLSFPSWGGGGAHHHIVPPSLGSEPPLLPPHLPPRQTAGKGRPTPAPVLQSGEEAASTTTLSAPRQGGGWGLGGGFPTIVSEMARGSPAAKKGTSPALVEPILPHRSGQQGWGTFRPSPTYLPASTGHPYPHALRGDRLPWCWEGIQVARKDWSYCTPGAIPRRTLGAVEPYCAPQSGQGAAPITTFDLTLAAIPTSGYWAPQPRDGGAPVIRPICRGCCPPHRPHCPLGSRESLH